ncbi:transcription factor AP-1 [Daphnia magna]|uniref:Transcription factor AP-1 n=1 Tax=Daphnia magna TaxID=35525 RepID=A0A0P5N418_9CRUS|nr:transcription factor AP-1 [Daphnia magna]KZS07996.1 Transcription factor AP-1 [Daphnia magna]
MDTAFFDDGRSYVPSSNSKEEVRKRLTLDLNSPRLKKPRFDVLLSSPDLNMLKLPSPELEKLIMQQNGLLSATPTPGGFVYPTPTSTSNTNSSSGGNNNNNPRAVTRDQEMYVRGFDDALAELHQAGAQQQQQVQILSTGQQQPNHHSLLETGSSTANNAQTAAPFGAAATRPPTSLSPYPTTMHQIPVKEEPRCGTSLSSSPPMSPIDMEDQERIKLERKRQRNRIAASKCRRRKLERIAKLEDKVKILKNDNSELGTVVVKLRQQVCGLKEQVMEHINCGCQIMLTNQF